MKKKAITFKFLALAILFLLMVTGCGSNDEASIDDVSTIVLGVPTALGSIEGADSLKAVELAVEEINNAGGVSVDGEKRPLEVVSIDTREHEPGLPVHDALAALEKMIVEKKPDAIVVGSFRSEVLLSAMDLIAKYKIPYICTIAMTPDFQKKVSESADYKYMFRMGLNSPYLVNYLSDTMAFINQKFDFNKVYIVTQDVLWAKGTGTGLEKWFQANGWDVVGFDSYPTGASDFSSTLGNARAGNAQVIVPIFDMPQSGILLKQARAMQVPALMAGFISPAASDSAWQTFEGEVEGLVNLVFEIGPIPLQAVPKSVEFNANYGKKYGEETLAKLSGHGPGPAYDSIYVLADAIERAGTLESEALVTALEGTDMDGVIGKIKFTNDHQVIYGLDPKETAIGAVFQWKTPGVRVPVFPEVAAEGEIELPPYIK